MRRNTSTYPSFPEIEEQLGYNPARFLVPTDDAHDKMSWRTRATAFIRGMDDIETIRAWMMVEAGLELGANGGARQEVITWLNHRQAALNGTDLSAVRTEHRESARDETAATTEKPAHPTGAETDGSPATALATDGGAQATETPQCPGCQGELTEEEIAGEIGYWCPQCGDFQEPIGQEGSA